MNQSAEKSMENEGGVLSAFGFSMPPDEACAVDQLSRQLLSWSHLWSGHPEVGEVGSKHHLVRKRLATWLERCIGHRTHGLLTSSAEDLSLAISTPLLTAFLGRRATREFSRQVLRDL